MIWLLLYLGVAFWLVWYADLGELEGRDAVLVGLMMLLWPVTLATLFILEAVDPS